MLIIARIQDDSLLKLLLGSGATALGSVKSAAPPEFKTHYQKNRAYGHYTLAITLEISEYSRVWTLIAAALGFYLAARSANPDVCYQQSQFNLICQRAILARP